MATNNLEENLEKYLKDNEYPGRVIIIGMNDAGLLTIVYAIMGRSENSQNRFFEQIDEDSIRTAPIDVTKVKDPELIMYNALKKAELNNGELAFVVTNGRQTGDIASKLKTQSFQSILKEWKHEPDAPNYTSRISGVIYINKNQSPKFSLSIIRPDMKDPENNSMHEFFEDLPVIPGTGFCISTYARNGDTLPPFEGEPFQVPLIGDAKQIAEKYWNILNVQNRVALFVKTIDPKLFTSIVEIINKKN